ADDVGAMAGAALLHNAVHGPAAHAGVVLGNGAHQEAHYLAQDDGQEHVHAGKRHGHAVAHELHGLGHHPLHEGIGHDGGEDHGAPVADVQGLHHAVGLLVHAHEEGAHDAEEHAEARDHHGEQDGGHATEVVLAHHLAAQHHSGQHSGHVAAEEVGAHAGHVAHVVAHVVGDGGGVAGIILG